MNTTLDKNPFLFLDQVTTLYRRHAASDICVEFPVHCMANENAFLSATPNTELMHWLPEKLKSYAPYAIDPREHLLKALDDACRQGVAYDRIDMVFPTQLIIWETCMPPWNEPIVISMKQ